MMQKSDVYYRFSRSEVAALVPAGAQRVLSVGCGAGAMERVLKRRAAEVVGVEMHGSSAEEAARYLDRVIVGDVEALDLPFEEGHFDCIVYADVLEHLRDPCRVLEAHRRLLVDGGKIVISLPNVRFWSILRMLVLRGDWAYQPIGLMDETHLRMFTAKSAHRLILAAGYRVVTFRRKLRLFEQTSRYTRMAQFLAFWGLEDFLTYQLLFVAEKGLKSG